MTQTNLEDLTSLCKRRGFIYQGSEIYGGLAGTWDYGPLGTQLKRNIENEWLKFFVDSRDDMYQIESAIIMNPKVWEASGHTETFNDPLVEDLKTKKRYRLDHLLEEAGIKNVDKLSFEEMIKTVKDKGIKSPEGNELGNPAKFNLLFKTHVGSVEDETSIAYLRGETAQGMFTNFKNVIDSFYPDLPFGVAQIGKSFRNEISPRDFIFRVREFEIMELEYFVKPVDWEKYYERWRKDILEWFDKLGLSKDKIKEHEVPAEDRAHYSKRTTDFYYNFPSLGFDEIGGLAYRTDFDLKNHQEKSGKNLEYRPKDGSSPLIPNVVEPTFGLDRHVMAVISEAYKEDEVNGEKRIYLAFPNHLAPIKVAVFPLLKNKPELTKKARQIYKELKQDIGAVMWDDNGNIGKRYRRQDEIGTPFCVTIDFQSLDDDTVTLRNRNTTKQTRVGVKDLLKELKSQINK